MTKKKFDPKTVVQQKVVSNDEKTRDVYEQIWTTQQAINTAITENRVVRYKTDKSNKQIKKEVDDLKGCSMRKPDRDSKEVAIIPPGIEDFSFEKEVDESLIIVPKPNIWTP